MYALLNGLATKVIEVVKKPLETQIIEEIKPPPPPPPVQLPPPPKFVAPPPPYIPPPEVQVNVPPPPNAIQTTTSVVPTESPPIAAVAPPGAARHRRRRPAPRPHAACPNYATALGDQAYPRDAIREGIWTRRGGRCGSRSTATRRDQGRLVVSSSNRVFARAAHQASCAT